jgi:hypothetical protein
VATAIDLLQRFEDAHPVLGGEMLLVLTEEHHVAAVEREVALIGRLVGLVQRPVLTGSAADRGLASMIAWSSWTANGPVSAFARG